LRPVFLLSGVAATLGVLTNRLGRIVDRARTLEERFEEHPGSVKQLQRRSAGAGTTRRLHQRRDLAVRDRRVAGGAGGGHAVRQRFPGVPNLAS